MSARVFVGCLACWLFLSMRPGPARAQVWVKAGVGTQSGTTDYDLAAESLEQERGGQDLRVRSLLKWPLNFVIAGFEAGASLRAARTSDHWLIEGRLDTSLGNARGTMDDRDWISSQSEGSEPARFFSLTKSETDSFALLSELSAGYRFGRFFEQHRLHVDVLVGSRQEYYALTARGAEGSYRDSAGNVGQISISNRSEAVDYYVLHWMPFIGSRFAFQVTRRLRLPLSLRVHSLWSQSHDDHLLRRKDAFGRAYGMGMTAAIAPELVVIAPLSIGLSAELTYLRSIVGVLRQKFYGDDPATIYDERELTVPEADFVVESLRLQGMLFARLTF